MSNSRYRRLLATRVNEVQQVQMVKHRPVGQAYVDLTPRRPPISQYTFQIYSERVQQ